MSRDADEMISMFRTDSRVRGFGWIIVGLAAECTSV